MNSDDDVVVSDFGLGRFLKAVSTRKTPTGGRMGTEPYAAPEQWTDAKSADERADIFSLGRILYELHTAPLVSARQNTSKIDPAIALVIERCTAEEPKERFQTVTELKECNGPQKLDHSIS
jgi:eukaryotic-like serine/threonine-protein kinase